MTTPLSDLYVHVLTERLGMQAQVDDHANVLFTLPNSTITIVAILDADADPEYVHLQLPLGSMPEGTPRAALLDMAMDVTLSSKGVSVLITPDAKVALAYEAVKAGPDQYPTADLLTDAIPRAIGMLLYGARKLRDKVVVHTMEQQFTAHSEGGT